MGGLARGVFCLLPRLRLRDDRLPPLFRLVAAPLPRSWVVVKAIRIWSTRAARLGVFSTGKQGATSLLFRTCELSGWRLGMSTDDLSCLVSLGKFVTTARKLPKKEK